MSTPVRPRPALQWIASAPGSWRASKATRTGAVGWSDSARGGAPTANQRRRPRLSAARLVSRPLKCPSPPGPHRACYLQETQHEATRPAPPSGPLHPPLRDRTVSAISRKRSMISLEGQLPSGKYSSWWRSPPSRKRLRSYTWGGVEGRGRGVWGWVGGEWWFARLRLVLVWPHVGRAREAVRGSRESTARRAAPGTRRPASPPSS
jgi:hypothetical protein